MPRCTGARRCRSSASRRTSGARGRCRPARSRAFRDKLERDRHQAGGGARQLPDQPGGVEPVLRERSIAAFGEELDRAETLGLAGVVIHPGCYTTGTEEHGLTRVADAVRGLLKARRRGKTLVILEHTAGQGTSLGWRFEQLAAMIDRLDGDARVAVCLDTCHLWAAGYDLGSEQGYRATFDAFDRSVGLDRLRVFHVNDSKKPLGSRRDRHDTSARGRSASRRSGAW